MTNTRGGASNLLVDVSSYNSQSTGLQTIFSKTETLLASYIQNLVVIQTSALKSGATAEAFCMYVTEVQKLAGTIGSLGERISKSIISFLKDIDDADCELYPNQGQKYFTDEDFQQLLAVVDKTPELSVSTANSWLENLVGKLISFFVKLAGFDTKEYINTEEHKLVQRMNETKELVGEEVMKIKMNLRGADRNSQQVFANYYQELLVFARALNVVKEIITPNYSNLSVENVKRLSDKIKELQKYTVKINEDAAYVADEQVYYFAKDVDGYYDESLNTIRTICEDSIGALMVTDFDRYRTAVNMLRDEFNQASEDYVNSKEKFNETKAKFDEMLALYNKYGKEWDKHFKGTYAEMDIFNKIISNAKKVSDKVDGYIDIWYQMFFDLSLSQEALERFKATDDCSNENVAKALERITELYDKNVTAYFSDTIETILLEVKNKGVKFGIDTVLKKISSESFVVGKILENITDVAFAEAPAVAMYDTIEDTINKFNASVEQLKNAGKDSPNYAELVENVRTNFNYAKNAQLKFFKSLSSSSSGQVKNYYEQCSKALSSANLNDNSPIDLQSEHEYYGGFNYFDYIINNVNY